ncbi:ATP-binding cassette domain-containing protein [Ruminococcus sp. RTP21484sp1_RTP21281st1_A2_RTP21281_210402]|uniref:ABC transporter ATP-binding protein n=1 Tax=unclassified Ruminococcus TaxID=2608920 RepID=UPI0034A57D94
MNILSIRNLQKRYGNKEVLKDINLDIPEHSVFGFVGKNGAGKTTVMKLVLGLLRADEGEIYVCNKKVSFGETETNKYIGYLPDVPEFYPFMTALEYLNFCGELCGMCKRSVRERGEELLEMVGLSKESHRIGGFSRGMKQRLGIAQALLHKPRLLICDEPTSALDPIGRKKILDILYKAKEQTTIVFSTHILSDVERICTDVAFLEEGNIALKGRISTLRNSYSDNAYIIETVFHRDSDILARAFPELKEVSHNTLVLEKNDEKLLEILSYINKNRISFQRIEREEPSLEKIFMKVVK